MYDQQIPNACRNKNSTSSKHEVVSKLMILFCKVSFWVGNIVRSEFTIRKPEKRFKSPFYRCNSGIAWNVRDGNYYFASPSPRYQTSASMFRIHSLIMQSLPTSSLATNLSSLFRNWIFCFDQKLALKLWRKIKPEFWMNGWNSSKYKKIISILLQDVLWEEKPFQFLVRFVDFQSRNTPITHSALFKLEIKEMVMNQL